MLIHIHTSVNSKMYKIVHILRIFQCLTRIFQEGFCQSSCILWNLRRYVKEKGRVSWLGLALILQWNFVSCLVFLWSLNMLLQWSVIWPRYYFWKIQQHFNTTLINICTVVPVHIMKGYEAAKLTFCPFLKPALDAYIVTTASHFTPGVTAPPPLPQLCTHYVGGCVSHRVRLDSYTEKNKTLILAGNRNTIHRLSSP